MKKILILNLTRMGDLMMTTPLIAGLKQTIPGAHVTILANSKFSEVCRYNSYIDEMYEVNIVQFEKKIAEGEVSFYEIYTYLEGLVDKMRALNFDMLINLTHSKLSAVFSSLLNIQDVRGFVSDETGNRVVSNPWFVYFCNLLFNRPYNRFHLTDINQKAGDTKRLIKSLTFEIPDEANEWAKDYLQSHNISDEDTLIAFQPASSREDRRWEAKNFIELGNILKSKLGAKVIVLGVKSEASLVNEIASQITGGAIDASGKTTIPQLGAILKRCNALVTNDTGTMHIASAVNTPIVALFFTHAFVHETGPYGEGHLVIQANAACSPCSHNTKCNNMICKNYILPEEVERAIYVLLSKDQVKPALEGNGKKEIFKNSTLFRSVFDEDGMLAFNPVTKKSLLITDILAIIYRAMWVEVLGKNDFPDEKEMDLLVSQKSSTLFEKFNTFFLVDIGVNLKREIEELLLALGSIKQCFINGSKVTSEILMLASSNAPDLAEIKRMGELIADIDNEIEKLGNSHPHISPIIRMFSFGKENLAGENIADLARGTNILYKNGYTETYIVEGILRKTGEWLLR
jgi:ADP-heptose:LPS heptosyltransferase